ncbi:MAG TPA: histidine kinase [Candidatus Dormibacteraeota bacterium]|nr:histidine kinase [Candidatus Dormibacteraeota bacterium]
MTLGFPKAGVVAEIEARPAESPDATASPAGHMARELHDLVAQPLISLVLAMHDLRDTVTDDVAARELNRIEDNARAILRNTRELLIDMRGQGEIRLDFRQVLKNELARTTTRGAVPTVQVSSSWPEWINGWAAFNLLRIIQEATANASRHGHASHVEVILSTSSNEEAVIVVVDDGLGLGESPTGIGMIGMQERAVILGGAFSAVARLGGGTRIEVRIPLQRLR